jgi:nicotinate-nucleotide pyrophosphorylase (carboxylating)
VIDRTVLAPAELPVLVVESIVRAALQEDLGRAGDVTTHAVIAAQTQGSAIVVARREGRVAGLGVAALAFGLIDAELTFEALCADGADVHAGQRLATVHGRVRSLLTGERTALNFLGHLSGIAEATRELVQCVRGTRARIADTRKTTPGLRVLEKYAVRVGGGINHRFGLDDAVLIKDNHIAAAGGIAAAVTCARAAVGHMVKIEVEVDTLAQLDEALAFGVDVVLLDNMSLEQLRQAVRRVNGRCCTEASGSITSRNVAAVAASGVDVISVGWITHSAPSLDVALDMLDGER